MLPGFVDCHVHLLFSGVHPLKTLQTPFSYPYFEAVRNLRTTLDLGITTVRDAGGADLGVKEAVANGLIPGPRVLIAVSMLSQTGGHGDGWYPSGCSVSLVQPHPGRPNTVVDGPEEIRRVVRELIRAGADVIKVATSGGVLSARDDPRHGHFRDDEVAMMVHEAEAAGISVMAHAQATDGHQDRGTQRGAVHRARHLPRRRGDRDDARLGHLAGADAGGAAGGAGAGRRPGCRTRTRCWPRRGWCWRSTPSRYGGRSRPG